MLYCDLLIIGAGSAGCSAAQMASQAGKKVILVEKSVLGGTCVNDGCIPFKALLQLSGNIANLRSGLPGIMNISFNIDYPAVITEVQRRIETVRRGLQFSLRKVSILTGNVVLKGDHLASVEGTDITFSNVLIATGCVPNSKISPVKALLSRSSLPSNAVVAGSGAVGIEATAILAQFGVPVTLLEKESHICPKLPEILRPDLAVLLQKSGISPHTNMQITKNSANEIQLSSGETLQTDFFLRCTGSCPVLPQLTTSAPVPQTDVTGYIVTDAHQQTTVPHWFAAGDICSNSMRLAYTASRQAQVAVSSMFALSHGSQSETSPAFLPYCIFTPTPLAWFGTFDTTSSIIKKTFYKASPAAVAEGTSNGFVLCATTPQGKLTGAAVCGTAAQELIHQLLLCASFDITAKERHNKIITLHPVLSELLEQY